MSSSKINKQIGFIISLSYRFFTISKHIVLNSEQNSEDNSNKSSFASNSGFSVRDLDLGYMDDFYKN
jgi:hypothetical protein